MKGEDFGSNVILIWCWCGAELDPCDDADCIIIIKHVFVVNPLQRGCPQPHPIFKDAVVVNPRQRGCPQPHPIFKHAVVVNPLQRGCPQPHPIFKHAFVVNPLQRGCPQPHPILLVVEKAALPGGAKILFNC